jgi:hypothetical protein
MVSITMPGSYNRTLALLWVWLMFGGGDNLDMNGDAFASQPDVANTMRDLRSEMRIAMCRQGLLAGSNSRDVWVGGNHMWTHPVEYWTINAASLLATWQCTPSNNNNRDGGCCYECKLAWRLSDRFDLNVTERGDAVLAQILQLLGVDYNDSEAWWWEYVSIPPSPPGPYVSFTAFRWSANWEDADTTRVCCPVNR